MAGKGGGSGKPPAKKAAAAKPAPRKRTPAVTKADRAAVTDEDRATAAAQIASVTPIRGRKGRGSRTASQRGRRSATTPADLELFARRIHVMNLRRLGLQWEQVAHEIRTDERFGPKVPSYGRADASNDLKAILDHVTVEAALEVRQEDLATLASAQRQIVPMIVDTELPAAVRLRAVDRLVSVLDRRSRYLGLDAPIKHQLTGADGGPIQIDTTDDAAIYAAALDALDDALPHVDPIDLPGAPS